MSITLQNSSIRFALTVCMLGNISCFSFRLFSTLAFSEHYQNVKHLDADVIGLNKA